MYAHALKFFFFLRQTHVTGLATKFELVMTGVITDQINHLDPEFFCRLVKNESYSSIL